MKSKLTCNAANPAALPGPITCGSRTWRNDEDLEVLDELNAQLKAHGVRFAPDISTASRATTGGMISNNSCGARSVMYGKTIDHVLELDVVLSDGSPAHMRPLTRAELDAACSGDTLEARCYRTVRRIARECARGDRGAV